MQRIFSSFLASQHNLSTHCQATSDPVAISQRKRTHTQQSSNSKCNDDTNINSDATDQGSNDIHTDATSSLLSLPLSSLNTTAAEQQDYESEEQEKKKRRTRDRKKEGTKEHNHAEISTQVIQPINQDDDTNMNENATISTSIRIPTFLISWPSVTMLTSLSSKIKSTKLTFDRVMIDECMSLMLQFTSRQDRISQMSVSKHWESSTRLPSTWRRDTLSCKTTKSHILPSSWLLCAVSGVRMDYERVTCNRFSTLCSKLNHLRRMTLLNCNMDLQYQNSKYFQKSVRIAFQRLRLQELEIHLSNVSNTIWSALFKQESLFEENDLDFCLVTEEEKEEEKHAQQPAIWSWCESLVNLTVYTKALRSKVASIFRTLKACAWLRLETFTWCHQVYLCEASPQTILTLNQSDLNEFRQFLTPHCLPSITSLEENMMQPEDSRELISVNIYKLNLPTLTSFHGGIHLLTDGPNCLVLELPPSSITQLELSCTNESCQLKQFTQLRELTITTHSLRWTGSWLSFFECIGSDVMPNLEKLTLPLSIHPAKALLQSYEEEKMGAIFSGMTQLTSLDISISHSDSYRPFDKDGARESHWIEFLSMIPLLTKLALISHKPKPDPLPKQEIRNLLILSITQCKLLQSLYIDEVRNSVFSTEDCRRLIQMWNVVSDKQIQDYQLRMGQTAMRLAVNDRVRMHSNLLNTLQLSVQNIPGDSEHLKWMTFPLAAMSHLTSLTILRDHLDNRQFLDLTSPHDSYLVQLVRLEQLQQLHIRDGWYHFNDDLFNHWTLPGHFSQLREISLQLSPLTKDISSSVRLLRLPQLRRIEFLHLAEEHHEPIRRVVLAANEAGRKSVCRVEFGEKKSPIDKFFYN